MAEAPSQGCSEEQELLLAEGGAGLSAQWGLEDEEEVTPERQEQERDRQLGTQDQDGGGPCPEPLEQEKLLKASESPELDEDEGFSDWSQKPERRQQEPPWGASPEGDPEEDRPCRNQDGAELSPDTVCLDKLQLHSGPEPQGEPGPGEASGDSQALAGAEPAQEQHERCQPPRTPSPSALETTGQGSPPLSPSTNVIARTESLFRSVDKSNSVKKSQPALAVSKIGERLEQYTQAVEGPAPVLGTSPPAVTTRRAAPWAPVGPTASEVSAVPTHSGLGFPNPKGRAVGASGLPGEHSVRLLVPLES
ncbi:lymphocyte-specific protein 1 [Pteropus vampyrus]|uniref:Lymphocyte-specific protein 1 n=1 Tax=Pteropus vampyrus TaxID=132908 RepID=A0A6P6D0N1_PTEVA|nr:lymphocyte-specific protein 1 [Pteropus vampyrus]